MINLAAFGGLVADSMTRGQGWRFLDMGRKLERAVQIAVLLREHPGRRARAGSAAAGGHPGDRRQLDDLPHGAT